MREKKINVAILNHIPIGLSSTSLDIMPHLFCFPLRMAACKRAQMVYNAGATMNIRIIRHLTPRHFHEMEALELRFYAAEFITPAEETLRWYRHHPHSTVAAEADGRLVGFVNLFPVRQRVYEAILAGSFNDHFMELDDVAPLSETPLHMFLSCVVTAPEARPFGTTRKLLQTAVRAYAGLHCAGVVTDNVTDEGCAFSERYGFTRLCRSDHGSWVYRQDWADFVSQVNR